MVKEEIWGVPIERIRQFFREQEDVTEQDDNHFSYANCAITLWELKPRGLGIWTSRRTRIHIEGNDADVSEIYHRFFIRFLTAGG